MATPIPRSATLPRTLGIGAVVLVILGLIGAQLGLPVMAGFYLFAAGALLGGLVTTIAAIVGLVLNRKDAAARSAVWPGLALGVGLLLVVAGAASTGSPAPTAAANDITTDLDDPPEFASASDVPDFAGRDMSYPAKFIPIVRSFYTDLAPIELSAPPARAYERSLAAAKQLGWEIVHEDAASGRFDARQVTRMFRFVDDVTVRVRPNASGSIVDVRSKSRVGQGDLGANAARIRAFADALSG